MFLSQDPEENARLLTNFWLDKQIDHLANILFDVLYYCVGVRSKRAFKFYFSRDKREESLNKFFPTIPTSVIPPFLFYSSVEAKWARKCGEHYMLLSRHLEYACLEYVYRFDRSHPVEIMVPWFLGEPIQLGLQNISFPMVGLKTIVLPYRNLPPKYRRRDIVQGYREYFASLVNDPMSEYLDAKREVPEFLLKAKGYAAGEILFDRGN